MIHHPFLFETIEPLADAANPEAACCPTCAEVKPIEFFMRRPSVLEAKRWGWDKLRDKRHTLYVGKECNECALTRREKSVERAFDYEAYNLALMATGRYETVVPHPTLKHTFITHREALVLKKREQRRERKVKAGRKAYAKGQAPVYMAFLKALRNERARIKAKLKSEHTSEKARAFCEAYLEYLTGVAEAIDYDRVYCVVQAKETIQDYAPHSVKLFKETREAYQKLGGGDREHIKARYL
jgi:hypothetical protein